MQSYRASERARPEPRGPTLRPEHLHSHCCVHPNLLHLLHLQIWTMATTFLNADPESSGSFSGERSAGEVP